MNWERVRQEEWESLKAFLLEPWELLKSLKDVRLGQAVIALLVLPIVLAAMTVALAIAGFLISVVLDESGIVDWIQYDKVPNGSANLSDWIRWAEVGWGSLIALGAVTYLGGLFVSPIFSEVSAWNAAKQRLQRERIAEWQREQAEKRQREYVEAQARASEPSSD